MADPTAANGRRAHRIPAQRRGAQNVAKYISGGHLRTAAEKHDGHELIKRREKYPSDVPLGGLILIKSVDVQKDRLEVYTCAYGIGDECWAIDYHVIASDPTKRSVWDELTKDTQTDYRHENGHLLTASLTAIDEGYKRDEVRKWVKARRGKAIAVKGDSKAGALLFRTQKKFVQVSALTTSAPTPPKISFFPSWPSTSTAPDIITTRSTMTNLAPNTSTNLPPSNAAPSTTRADFPNASGTCPKARGMRPSTWPYMPKAPGKSISPANAPTSSNSPRNSPSPPTNPPWERIRSQRSITSPRVKK